MESWRESKKNEKISCQTICIESYPGCKANIVDHGKDVGRAQVTTGHEGLIVNMISIWSIEEKWKWIYNLEEMKTWKYQTNLMSQEMLTTITTDGAGDILVTWKLDFNNFCKRYFLVANLQISQELSVYHFLN